MEVHHLNGNHADNRYVNLSLLHGSDSRFDVFAEYFS
jgi:hypothetical protein